MSHQQQLVDYVKQHHRCDDAAAEAWLDAHCPQWRTGKRVEAGLIEVEEGADA